MDGITDPMDMSLSKLQEMVKDREAWHALVHKVRVGRDSATEQQPGRRVYYSRNTQKTDPPGGYCRFQN